MQPNYFDIAVLVLILAFGIRGGARGFVAEIAGLAGLAAGLVLARSFSAGAADALERYIAPSAAPTVAFVALVIGGMLAVGLCARLLRRVLDVAFAGWLDHLLGAAAGAAKGALLSAAVAWIAVLLAPQIPLVHESRAIPPLLDFVRWAAEALKLSVPLP